MARAKCPNKNNEDWKLLVRLFGEDKAWDIYDKNGEDIPTRQRILDGFRRANFNKFYEDGKITSDYRYYINKLGEQEELTPVHNPITWAIENRENLIEKFRTDESTGRRVKVYKAFTPSKADRMLTDLRSTYPFATFSKIQVSTDSNANTRIKVSTPYSVPDYESRQIAQREAPIQQEERADYVELKERLLSKFNTVESVVLDPTMNNNGEVRENGSIIAVNPDSILNEAVGHEFGHLFIDLIGGLDNSLVKAGLKQLSGTELERSVIEAYADLAETNSPKLQKEILATAIGKETDQIFKEVQEEESRARWNRWLIRFFRKLKQLLGIEKNAVKQLTREMLSKDQTNVRGEVADSYESRPLTGYKAIDEVNEEKSKEEIVRDKAIDALYKKLVIYKNRGDKAFVENIEDALEELEESQSVVEGLANFITLAGREIAAVYKRYEKAKEKYETGNTEIFDLKVLNTWHEYVSAFNILDDIKGIIVSRIGHEKMNKEFKITSDYIDQIIKLRNLVQEKAEFYAMEGLVNLMEPNFTRIDKAFEQRAEREYLKLPKDMRKDMSLEAYTKKYIDSNAEWIEESRRDHLKNELQEAQFDISWAERWLDNITSSDDTVVSTMVKTIALRMMDSKLKKTEYTNKMWELTKDLEKVLPKSIFKSQKKKYDFLLEKDDKGNPTGSLITKYKSSLMRDYLDYKESILNNEALSDAIKAAKLRDWKRKNVPLDYKNFNKGKYAFIKTLVERGVMTPNDVDAVFMNDQRRDRMDLKEVLRDNPIAAEEIKTWVKEHVWEYRIPIDKWKNPQFEELQKLRESNPEDPRIKFYDFVIDSIEESDAMVPQKSRLSWFGISYDIPRHKKFFDERVLDKDGIPTILKESTKLTLGKSQYDIERGSLEGDEKEVFLDELDRVKRFLPIHYSGNFDPNNQSYDIATIVTKRYHMALDYAHKQEILPAVEWSQYFINNRDVIVTDIKGNPIKNANELLRKRELTKSGLNSMIAAQYTDWLKMYFFEESRSEGLDFNFLGLEINSEKALDALNTNTAYAMLAFNVVQGIANINLAEVTQRIEAFAGEFYNMKDYQKAALKYDVHIPQIVGDVGNRRPTNLIDLIQERFDYLDDYKLAPEFRKKGAFSRSMRLSNAFFMSHMGEHMMQNKAALAMLNHIKLTDVNGNPVYKERGGQMSLLDAFYKTEDNQLEILDEGWTEDRTKKVKIKKPTDKELHVIGFGIQEHLAKMHGDYRDSTRAAWQYYALWRMAGMFRKFIVPGIRRRWSKSKKLKDGSRQFKYNEFGEYSYEGYYRTFGRFFGNLIKDLWLMKANIVNKKGKRVKLGDDARYSNLTAMEKANIKRVAGEATALVSMVILGNLFLRLKDEADDDSVEWRYSFLAYQALRLRSEIFFFANPMETARILRSPMASMSIIENLIKLLELVVNPFDDEKINEKFERGPWKGKWKGSKYLTNSLGQLSMIKQTKRLLDMENQLNWFD